MCLLPEGLRHSGVGSGIRGGAVAYIILAALLPIIFAFVISGVATWMDSTAGAFAAIFLPTIFLLLIIMPATLAEGFVHTVLKKRRRGEWS